MTLETQNKKMTQTPNTNPLGFDWNELKSRFNEVRAFMPIFIKNPLEGIKRVPNWDWWTIILLEVIIGAVCGFLSGIVSRHFLAVFGGLIVGPIMNLFITAVISGIMYYAGLFILKTELDFKKIFIVVVFAELPAQVLSILSPIARPITLICIIVTSLMLIVGMVENFMLDKKKMTQIIGALGGLLVVFWIYSVAVEATSTRIKVQDYTPESLDQIHKELSEGLEKEK